MSHVSLDLVKSAVKRLDELAKLPGGGNYHQVAMVVHELCFSISQLEHEGVPRESIQALLESAFTVHSYSPFITRLQTWPRGYPGDFETIEYLIDQQVRAPKQSIGHHLEYIALNSPIAQQHRNKVRAQANEIEKTIMTCPAPARVLVLAAGSSPDLASIQHRVAGREFQIVLNDIDQDALSFSLERLSAIADKIVPLHGNALSVATRVEQKQSFDLVVAGGLFDYLPNRQAGLLLRVIWERLLCPGGVLVFTNIAKGNPYRVWIEYLASWHLIERSAQDLMSLIDMNCGREAKVNNVLEGTGLTYLSKVMKA